MKQINKKGFRPSSRSNTTGLRTQLLPVEVGCRGFVAMASTMLLKGLGVGVMPYNKPLVCCHRLLSEAATGCG